MTIPLWIFPAYLAIGVVTFLPFNYLAWRQVSPPRQSFWRDFHGRPRPLAVLVQVIAWPAALWELVR